MNIWEKAPFVRLLPPLLVGILFAAKQTYPHPVLLLWLAGNTLICFNLATKIWVCGYAWRWIPGLCINVLIFSTGLLLYRQHQIELKPHWLGHHLYQAKYLTGTPENIAVPGSKSARIVLIVTSTIDSNGSKKRVAGKVILYIPNSFAAKVYPGDKWIIPAVLVQQIRSANNPAAFDYAQYCARQNIHHQAFLNEWQFKFISSSRLFNLPRILAFGQFSALKAMRETVPEKSRGIAMALLIGYRYEVDKSLLQAYTNTGVVHVIAVSGMHLGLIFLLLQKAIAFPDKRFKILKWVKAFLVLVIIWLFSGIAGAAASIIRAAFMFSVVLLSKLLRKPMDNIQSICLGAFALLCFNPFWLWDAGFQLSFAALLSIICYQPLVGVWVKVKNPMLKCIWDLTTVTLAAQILTLPISIGQFHQAPVYFLFANLLAVPLSSIALITAILQWIITSAGFSFPIPGQITGLLIQQMDAAILHINSLPGSVINQIEWTLVQTCIIYIIISAITIWLVYKVKQAAFVVLVSLSIFMAVRFIEHYQKSRQEILLIFQIPHKRLVVLLQGKRMNLLASEDSTESPDLQAASRFFFIRNLIPVPATLYNYHKYIIAIPANQDAILPMLELAPDYLILPGNLQNIEPLIPAINIRTTIVMDGKIPEWRARQLSAILKASQIKYFTTWVGGAFQIPLNKF